MRSKFEVWHPGAGGSFYVERFHLGSKKSAGAGGSAASHARARKILEAGIAALGGLEAIRETQDVSAKISGFSYARNQSVGVNPPFDKMTRDENLYIDIRNRRYIIETRDPLPGGFVFGGKQAITGNQVTIASDSPSFTCAG